MPYYVVCTCRWTFQICVHKQAPRKIMTICQRPQDKTKFFCEKNKEIRNKTCIHDDYSVFTTVNSNEAVTVHYRLMMNLHETTEICKLVDEVKQLTDVVRDGRRIGIHALQVLLIDLAYSY